MRLVADRTGVPIATGERLLTLPEFQALADLRAVSFFQPDLCHCGGFTAGRAIAAVAAAAQIGIAPHNPMGPVASVVDSASPHTSRVLVTRIPCLPIWPVLGIFRPLSKG